MRWRALEHGWSEFPAIEVWTGAEGIRMEAQVPGIDPDDLELTVVGDTLTIRGSRSRSGENDGETPHRRERESGKFARTIQLPFAVDGNRVQARFENGWLHIELPRSEKDLPRKITVKSA